jgi:predicted transcriptional regulator
MENDEIREAVEPVVKALEELGLSYYIGGSIASSVYGTARATMDIDLVSNLKQSNVEPLKKKLNESYFIDENMIKDAIKTAHHLILFISKQC